MLRLKKGFGVKREKANVGIINLQVLEKSMREERESVCERTHAFRSATVWPPLIQHQQHPHALGVEGEAWEGD